MSPGEVIPLIEWVQTGGDLVAYALIYFLWRFDRRLLKIELRIFGADQKDAG